MVIMNNNDLNLNIDLCGIKLKNPIITASGTFGFGREANELYSISEIGAIAVKGLTLLPRMGNDTLRVAETPMGMLNSVGLQNPGVDAFLRTELPFLKQNNCVVIANIAGNTQEDYVQMAEKISDSETDLIEMNISCPNVNHGGLAFGTDEKTVYEIVRAVKTCSSKPIIVKLTPNVTDITSIAKACENGGADAISLINTLLGMRIDVNTRKPILERVMGGLSGPAVKPVAVRMVWQVRSVTNLPIIGMGGISSGNDAVEFMLAGANAVAIGTATLINPYAPIKILNEIKDYLISNKVSDVKTLTNGIILNK